jgi:hypothetical protein
MLKSKGLARIILSARCQDIFMKFRGPETVSDIHGGFCHVCGLPELQSHHASPAQQPVKQGLAASALIADIAEAAMYAPPVAFHSGEGSS